MRDFGWWRRLPARDEPTPGGNTDPFARWERELDDQPPPVAAGRRDLSSRLVLGALAGFLLTSTVAIASATLVLDQVFGATGGHDATDDEDD